MPPLYLFTYFQGNKNLLYLSPRLHHDVWPKHQHSDIVPTAGVILIQFWDNIIVPSFVDKSSPTAFRVNSSLAEILNKALKSLKTLHKFNINDLFFRVVWHFICMFTVAPRPSTPACYWSFIIFTVGMWSWSVALYPLHKLQALTCTKDAAGAAWYDLDRSCGACFNSGSFHSVWRC